MSIYEEMAKFFADENGTDYEQELTDVKSLERMNRELEAQERQAERVSLNMRGFVPVEVNDFKGY